MKNSLKYIGCMSFVLNIVFIVTWIFVFSRHDNHNTPDGEFDALLQDGPSSYNAGIALFILTIISIIGFAKSNYFSNKNIACKASLFFSPVNFWLLYAFLNAGSFVRLLIAQPNPDNLQLTTNNQQLFTCSSIRSNPANPEFYFTVSLLQNQKQALKE